MLYAAHGCRRGPSSLRMLKSAPLYCSRRHIAQPSPLKINIKSDSEKLGRDGGEELQSTMGSMPQHSPKLDPLPHDLTSRISEAECQRIVRTASLLRLSEQVVQEYRRDGFVIIRDFFQPSTLSILSHACRDAAKRRGVDMPLPACDKTPNQPIVNAKVSMYARDESTGKPLTGAERAGQAVRATPISLDGSDNSTKIPAPKKMKKRRIKLVLRTQADVERAHRRILRERERGYKVAGVPPPEKPLEQMNDEERQADGMRQLNSYRESGKLEDDINERSNVDIVTSYMRNIQTAWLRLAYTDEVLRRVVRGAVGNALGRLGAQLSGTVALRLYNDLLVSKHPFSNALSHTCPAGGLNIDSAAKAIMATVMLSYPPESGYSASEVPPSGPSLGGYSIIPGSHSFMMKRTNQGRNLNGLQLPTSWNVGEWVRSVEGLRTMPAVSPQLRPGDVLFIHPLTVFGLHPNMDPKLDPWTLSLTLVPDGARYDGVPRGWMSKDSHGPLFDHKPQQVLNDPSNFPLMYHTLRDLDIHGSGGADDGDGGEYEDDPDADLLGNDDK